MTPDEIRLRQEIKKAKEAADILFNLQHDTITSVRFEGYALDVDIPKDLKSEFKDKLLEHYHEKYVGQMNEVNSLWNKIKHGQ